MRAWREAANSSQMPFFPKIEYTAWLGEEESGGRQVMRATCMCLG